MDETKPEDVGAVASRLLNGLQRETGPHSQGTRFSIQPHNRSSKANTTMLTEKHIRQLWERMGRIYGNLWAESFGEEDDGTWQKGLRGVTPQQIALAVDAIIDEGSPFPPTLPQFRAFCRAAINQNPEPPHQPAPTLPEPSGRRGESAADQAFSVWVRAMKSTRTIPDPGLFFEVKARIEAGEVVT